jgi:sugar phosphate isomerase/epimerase
MSLSRLPLSYCTNVHPGTSVAELEAGLDRYTVNIRREFGQDLAAGLWLAEPVVGELLGTSDGAARFANGLRARGLTCHTLNAFPYGNFHAERVKEQVYLPDWADLNRRQYTEGCAAILARLLPEGVDGSISTVPLGFKGFEHPADFIDHCIGALIGCAKTFDRIRAETGKMIRLAIEPEPLCVLETTPEAIQLFTRLYKKAEAEGVLAIVREHIGLCYDVCHQAVEFEDVAASIGKLDEAGVRINKVHISCAIHLDKPMQNAAAREALRKYIEPRYLHQTLARGAGGAIARAVDLNGELLDHPAADFAGAVSWRVHFHVPVDAERLGPLGTTRPALAEALGAVAKLDYAPHLEVETYTWEVLPGAGKADVVGGMARELRSTAQLLGKIEGRERS